MCQISHVGRRADATKGDWRPARGTSQSGEDDNGTAPAISHAIAAQIPGSQLTILPRLRRMALAEAPEPFNATLLDFLDGVRGHG